MKLSINCRFSGSVLFEHEQEGNTIRLTLEAAIKARAYLAGANLARANLDGAYLAGANLDGANLAGANLARAYLAGAETLKGERPIFQIGPIGSRCAYFVAYITDKGLRLRAGCFFGDVETFKKKLDREHGYNQHADEYGAALALIEKHAEIWTPAKEEIKEGVTA